MEEKLIIELSAVNLLLLFDKQRFSTSNRRRNNFIENKHECSLQSPQNSQSR